MLQVELRERMSTLRLCSSLKRSLASSGTNLAFFGSSKMAAATARQKSTSKPVQLPLSSGVEKPGRPWLTPQTSEPRSLTFLSVCAELVSAKMPKAIIRLIIAILRFIGAPRGLLLVLWLQNDAQ